MSPTDLLEASPARATLPIGADAPVFDDLLGVDGRRYSLSSFDDRDVLVLIFSSNRCPTAKAYAERLNALQSAHDADGVQVVLLNANDPHLYPDESYPRMVERAAEDGYTFPYLVDDGQRLAKAFGAACTFHVFVVDRSRRLRYSGRFDDSRLTERVTTHDLENAIDDILNGRDVRVATTRPFGCSLDFV